MDVVEKYFVKGIERIPNSPPDQNQRQDNGEVFGKVSEKFFVDHYRDCSTIDFGGKLRYSFDSLTIYIPR